MPVEQQDPSDAVWSSFAQAPHQFLSSSWPGRAIVFLLTGAVLGALEAALILGLISVGVVLLVVALGLATPAVMAGLAAGMARVERRRLGLIAVSLPPSEHLRTPSGGFRAWARTRLHEQVTWREVGYLLLNAFGLAWVDLSMLLLGLGLPILVITTPFYSVEEGPTPYLIGVAGLVLLPAGMYLLVAWSGARAVLAQAILGPQGADLQRRLLELSGSRARLASGFERERRALERDLHDGVQRHLVTATLALGMVQLDLPDDSPAAAEVAKAQRQTERALEELRALIRGVHPPVLSDRGLPAAIEDIAADVPVPVQVIDRLPNRLPPDVESIGYFCVAEATTNIIRHSSASQARIELTENDHSLQISVWDDGQGAAVIRPDGGLAGLGDRVSAIGGNVTVTSPAGGPTTVLIVIPLAVVES